MSPVWVLGDGGLVASYFGSTLQDREKDEESLYSAFSRRDILGVRACR